MFASPCQAVFPDEYLNTDADLECQPLFIFEPVTPTLAHFSELVYTFSLHVPIIQLNLLLLCVNPVWECWHDMFPSLNTLAERTQLLQ